MKTKLLVLFLSIASTMFADSITIKQKSGNETIVELSTNPVITFVGEDMVVTNDFTTISFPLDDIDCYVVNNVPSAIHEIADTPQYHNGHVVFNGLANGAAACVYSMDGRIVSQHFADASGRLDINLSNLPKGAYIISAPNNKIKVINK